MTSQFAAANDDWRTGRTNYAEKLVGGIAAMQLAKTTANAFLAREKRYILYAKAKNSTNDENTCSLYISEEAYKKKLNE